MSDNYLVSGPVFSAFAFCPGGANIPILAFAAKHQAAVLLTIPMLQPSPQVCRNQKCRIGIGMNTGCVRIGTNIG